MKTIKGYTVRCITREQTAQLLKLLTINKLCFTACNIDEHHYTFHVYKDNLRYKSKEIKNFFLITFDTFIYMLEEKDSIVKKLKS